MRKFYTIIIYCVICAFFFINESFCAVNFTPKNVKLIKTTTISTKEPKSVTESADKNEKEQKEIRGTSELGEVIPENPTYYSAPTKAMLDENIRYIQSPAAVSGESFGLIRGRRIRIKLDTEVDYDDNIFLTRNGQKGDYITRISPGIYGYAGNEEYTLLGFYEADVLIYGLNSKETRINQSLGGNAYLFKTGRLNVKLGDVVKFTTDPPTSEITAFVKRVHNDFNAGVNYEISPKTSAAFNYTMAIEYFLSDDYKEFNYFQHTFSPVFYYHLTPKTALSAEYNLGVTHYTGSAGFSSVYHQARGGITGELTPKSTIGLKAGYQYRVYESKDMKNAQGFVMECIYDYLWSPKTAMQLIASSNINESVYADMGYYNSYSLYANIAHHILYNLDININGLYIFSNYPHSSEISGSGWEKRHDNLFGAGAEAIYRFRTWLSVYAGYNFKKRTSNVKDMEYADNIVHGGVKLGF